MKTAGAAVVNLDLLTYAGNVENLSSLAGDEWHRLVRGDICDGALLDLLLGEHRPSAIVHFAAESHVDRSIAAPGEFLRTNVQGSFTLLEAESRRGFRFVHVSTDGVSLVYLRAPSERQDRSAGCGL
jgi:dTDP-glucose 4,6-dehydratase